MSHRWSKIGWMVLCCVGVVSCGESQQEVQAKAGAGKIQAVCTIGMIADIATHIAGDRADVQCLIGPGIDPHLYKATRSDSAALLQSDIVFYNGLMLEGKMADALVRAATAGKPVYAVTELLDETFLLEPEGFHGLYDPHVWMDPVAWKAAAEVVRDTFIAIDPAHKEGYQERGGAYIEKLNALDAYAERVLRAVPEKSRVLVTAHDAFNYFGKRYGYDVVGIQGVSTESEAGLRDIERIVDMLVSKKISAVFVESTVSPRNIKAIVAGARAKGHAVRIGGELFSDAMGTVGTYEGTYLGMIDHNVTTIARALGASDVPASGMAGQLHEME